MSASPRFWLITLSALLMSAVTFSLGMWQLDRAAQKTKLSQSRAAVQPMRLAGQWDTAKTMYVDNRQMTIKGQTRQGFFVVTPLLLSNSEFVLVERGWIGRHFEDRKRLQAVETPAGEVTIEVRKIADPVPPAVFAKETNLEHPIVQFVDVENLSKALQNKAYKGMMQQMGSASEGLQRHWYEPASGIEKHYGYAFQWFALCALVVGLYIWFGWIKKNEQN